ncbi:hypothetical protein PFICI_09541 [Pestalotiopsis fici W106-1]|uniref:Heterokaryon incompatibility domain-containing protein n=1 Tax=Pestalotiopsis fici (strain W106-1 / CGMCC3.15140) TaxID=1229662 RepID=W3X0M7_PESFW|nr:uncharacterized protein PFICI_09541 [Pestalotiopsis fici W106-1]ETS79688.1 hypothetical protein PFICI_09541 [Pestalotiopsis fici W106-1]
MTSPETYQYERLEKADDIRLLDILPGTDEDPIAISLQTVSLSTNPDFEALSYVWGDPAVTEQVACHGRLLRVTTNLFNAFRQLRLPDRRRTLWADAVCINQTDLDEKSQQIQIMHRIYKSCRTCAIWLGQADEHSAVALDIVQLMGEMVCRRRGISMEELESQPERDRRDPMQALRIGLDESLPAINSPRWFSLFRFLRREWFSRVWVVQEIYFSPNVLFYCGDRTTRYAPLFYTTEWILRNGMHVNHSAFRERHRQWSISKDFSSGTPGLNILGMRPECYGGQPPMLAQLLSSHRSFNATDPRDKVYAMMHLPPFRSEYPELVPDYRRSAEDIYTDVAFRLLTGPKHPFFVLTTIDIHKDPDEELRLPSWVPCWHRERKNPNIGIVWYHLMSTAVSEDAKAASRLALLPSPGRALQVRGFEFDVVQDVCEQKFWTLNGPDQPHIPLFSPLTPWEPYSPEAGRPPYQSVQGIMAAYCMTLTASCRQTYGFHSFRCGTKVYSDHVRDFVAWLTWIRTLQEMPQKTPHQNFYPPGLHALPQPTMFSTSDAEVSERSKRYSHMTSHYNIGRSLVRTRRGYLGTAPNNVRKGDVVCVFMGAAVPFVLRARDDTDGGYMMIGDANIHGIMDGEILRNWEDVKTQLRDLNIY